MINMTQSYRAANFQKILNMPALADVLLLKYAKLHANQGLYGPRGTLELDNSDLLRFGLGEAVVAETVLHKYLGRINAFLEGTPLERGKVTLKHPTDKKFYLELSYELLDISGKPREAAEIKVPSGYRSKGRFTLQNIGGSGEFFDIYERQLAESLRSLK